MFQEALVIAFGTTVIALSALVSVGNQARRRSAQTTMPGARREDAQRPLATITHRTRYRNHKKVKTRPTADKIIRSKAIPSIDFFDDDITDCEVTGLSFGRSRDNTRSVPAIQQLSILVGVLFRLFTSAPLRLLRGWSKKVLFPTFLDPQFVICFSSTSRAALR